MENFFKEEGRLDIDQIWEKIKKGLKDGATMSMEKIEEYTKIGKLKIEEMAAKRKIERNNVDIGERAFDLIAEGKGDQIADDLTVKKAIDNIGALRKELEEIEAKIRLVGQEAREKKAKSDNEEITGV